MNYLYTLLKESIFYFKKNTFILFFLFLISSLLDLFAIVSIFPLIHTIFDNSIDSNNAFISTYTNLITGYGIPINFMTTTLIVIIVFSTVKLVDYFAEFKSNVISQNIKIKIQKDALNKFNETSIFYFINQPAGTITNFYNREIPFVCESYRLILLTATRLIILIFIGLLMLYNDFYLALITLFSIMIFIILMKKFYNKIEKVSTEIVKKYQELANVVNYYINNIVTIKNSKMNKIKVAEIEKNNHEAIRLQIKNYNYRLLLRNFIEPSFLLFAVGVFYLASKMDISLTDSLILNFAIILRFSKQFLTLQNFYLKILNWKKNVLSKNLQFRLLQNHTAQDYINKITVDKISNITADNLTIQFAEKTIIQDLNISLNAPFFIKINGGNGTGKSSLAKAISGYFPVENNQILINKTCINIANKENLHEKILYLDKNPYILDGSLMKNILINVEESLEIKNEILNYIKKFNLDKIFNKDNIHRNLLSENGHNLSHGQIQKISIIRALIAKPDIMILDEATSNIDSENEKEIYELLFEEIKLYKGSLISISHNKRFDNIFEEIIDLENNRGVI